jgi:hypothetical protein
VLCRLADLLKDRMNELKRQMFCTHCGVGLIDRQGNPALQVSTNRCYDLKNRHFC